MDRDDGQSVIPAVRREERDLQGGLKEAQAEADRLVAEARCAAAERVEAAKQRMPQFIRDTLERRLRDVRDKAEAQRGAGQDEAAALEERARCNLSAAVARIVSAVVPGGKP